MTIPELPEVYQLKTNNALTKDLTTNVGLVFDGVLDGDFLEQKYREFVIRWPIVGGKLVTSTAPYSYTTGYLADVQSRNLDSFLASVLPAACIKALSQHSPTFVSCNLEADSIYHFNNMTKLGRPHESLISLRITTLKDATLLGFSMSHAACDGTSGWDVIRYYCDFVNSLDIPDLGLPPDYDTKLSTKILGEDKYLPELEQTDIITDPHKTGVTGAINYAKFIAQSVWRTVSPFREPEELKFIYLPTELVEKWIVEAQIEVDRQVKAGTLHPLIITKNDVITAWFYMMSFKNSNVKSSVNMGYSVSPRPYIKHLGGLYLKNAFIPALVHFPTMDKLQSMSQPEMALYIHQNVQAYTQPSVVRATLEFWEEVTEKGLSVTPLPPGGDLDAFGLVSSWTTFRFDSLSLKSALKNKNKSDGNGQDTIGTGGCVFTQPWVILPGNGTVRPAAIVMKDGDRGHWLRANNTVEAWKAFE